MRNLFWIIKCTRTSQKGNGKVLGSVDFCIGWLIAYYLICCYCTYAATVLIKTLNCEKH